MQDYSGLLSRHNAIVRPLLRNPHSQVTDITAKSPSRWNPILAPPSKADEATHVAYFARNAEAPPVAVLVFHGIGEEVRFETLSRAASLILAEAEERGATGVSVVIRSVPKDVFATDLEMRAALAWTETDGTKRQGHAFEASR